jgi:hypothetical protein
MNIEPNAANVAADHSGWLRELGAAIGLGIAWAAREVWLRVKRGGGPQRVLGGGHHEGLRRDVDAIRSDLGPLRLRVDSTEVRVQVLEARHGDVVASITSLERKMDDRFDALTERLDKVIDR